MNLVLHQFRTDLQHFRGRLFLLWLAFAAVPALNLIHALSGIGASLFIFFIQFWQMLFALIIVMSLIQADSLTGDTAAWLCRPVRRLHLFWAKSTFIFVCLFLPW